MKKSQFVSLGILIVAVTILIIIGTFNRDKGPEVVVNNTPTPKSSSEPLHTPDDSATEKPTQEPTPTPTPVKTPVVFPEVDKGYIATLKTEKASWYWSVQQDKQGYWYPVFNDLLKKQIEGFEYIFTKPVENKKIVYLTFNEGWDDLGKNTEKILDVLKEKKINATFYITLEYLNANGDTVKRMLNEGNAIGSRGSVKKTLDTLSIDDAVKQLLDMEEAYRKVVGEYERMNTFRPIDQFSQREMGIANGLGYKVAFWSCNYSDWQEVPAENEQKTYNFLFDNLYDGAVYCLAATSKTNLKLLPRLIDEAVAQGYEFRVLD